MSSTGKHRGWLLVYELQYWLILAASVLGAIVVSELSASGVVSVLFLLAFWGALIGSLYGSSDVIRRIHIAFNWFAAAATALAVVNTPSATTNPVARYGEYFGDGLSIAFFAAWAVYWHRSKRVRNSYPTRASGQEVSSG